MSQIKIVFTDDNGKVRIELEGDVPDTDVHGLMSDAQLMAMTTIDQLKIQELLHKLTNDKKNLTNSEEDDKTKYRN